MKRALVFLVACHADLLGPPEPLAGRSAHGLAPIADGNGGWYAVLAPVAMQSEISNLGGRHLTLRVVDRAPEMPQWIHLGGHGQYVDVRCVDRFVARITALAPSIRIGDTRVNDVPRDYASPDPGLVHRLPAYDGALLGIARVAPGEDLAERLARAAEDGVTGGAAAQGIAADRGHQRWHKLDAPDVFCEASSEVDSAAHRQPSVGQ